MIKIIKKPYIILKIIIFIFIAYYLYKNIDLSFFEKIYDYYYLIFLFIPISFIKVCINTLKISYLLKILKKKDIFLKKIFNILLVSQLSTTLPASFLASKTWIDTNLIKLYKFNFKEYLKFNILILFFSLAIFMLLYFFRNNTKELISIYILIFFFTSLFEKCRNYLLYFNFFFLNMLLNISVSFFIIYFVSPNLIEGNIFNILFSAIISSYLNLLSFLPFNIGYSQVVHSITFEMFSLPSDIALIISTVKQLTQVIFVLIISIFLTVNLKKKSI